MSKLRVLVVDDTPEVRLLVGFLLEEEPSWTVVGEASNGIEAIEHARASRPDLVLLDMSMPVKDGWTAARELRADPATASVPIVALTAHALAGDRDRALAAGCDDYHPKPVEFSRLLGQVEALLREQGPARSY